MLGCSLLWWWWWWENPYLNSGFIHPNFIYPRRRALSLPFLGACPAKKIQSFPLAFLPFKFLFLLKQKQEEKNHKVMFAEHSRMLSSDSFFPSEEGGWPGQELLFSFSQSFQLLPNGQISILTPAHDDAWDELEDSWSSVVPENKTGHSNRM